MLRKLTYHLFFAVALTFSSVSYAQNNSKMLEQDYVQVYPNPITSEGIIKISDAVDIHNRKISISFYNVVGKEVQRISNIQQNEVRFNREKFLSGMYIYQLKVDDKAISTGRITVR